jgi:peptide-methionine (S)-S-oxide reductase
MEKAIFGAGCFWGVEAEFRKKEGVFKTSVGYSGGTTQNPTYQDVCSNRTGHAEVVQVEYDPEIISYKELLNTFWSIHNPTMLNRQGPDVGSQYRSVILYMNESQKNEALASLNELEQQKKFKNPIVTEIVPAEEYYEAEQYHQQYFEKRGLLSCHI